MYEGGTGDLDADGAPTWYGLGTMAGLGGIPMEAFRTVAVSPDASLLLLLPAIPGFNFCAWSTGTTRAFVVRPFCCTSFIVLIIFC